MPSKPSKAVRGSVMQRTLIPEGLSVVLNVSTVPLAEIAEERKGEEVRLRPLLAQILGISETAILESDTYESLCETLSEGRFFTKRPFPHDWPYYWDYYQQLLSQRGQRFKIGSGAPGLLASDALALMVRPPTAGAGLFVPLTWDAESLGASDEEVDLALRCYGLGVRENRRVLDFVASIGEYEIPSGQSPATKSDSLLRLIEGSRAVCLAPLVGGGAVGVTQLNQGHLVLALQTTCTAAAMSLILIGTISVADYLVHHVLHRRTPEGPDKPTPKGGNVPNGPGGPPARRLEEQTKRRQEKESTAPSVLEEGESCADTSDDELGVISLSSDDVNPGATEMREVLRRPVLTPPPSTPEEDLEQSTSDKQESTLRLGRNERRKTKDARGNKRACPVAFSFNSHCKRQSPPRVFGK